MDGDFPSGPVLKNLSSSVEDKGLIPDQRTKVPQRGAGNKARVLQLLGLMLHNQRSLCTATRRPHAATREEALCFS